jgi:threonyl-tRNA synthetase
LELWPAAKLAIGPAIEEGFYYDFDLPVALNEEDLAKIEKKMAELKKKKLFLKNLFCQLKKQSSSCKSKVSLIR